MNEFLTPHSHQADSYSQFQIGRHIKTDWDEILPKSIVLLSIDEFRGGDYEFSTEFHAFRENLYALSLGNWKIPLVDIGTLKAGDSIKDTYFALEEILTRITEKQAFPLIIGGTQDLIVSLFKVLSKADRPLNYTSVDSRIPLAAENQQKLREDNVLNHLIMDESQLLFQYTNLANQSYLNSYQLTDTLEALDFDSFRLGELVQDIKESEPVFRSSDLASINLNATESLTGTDRLQANPNGLNSREICAIAKMAGLSTQLKALLISNYFEDQQNQLLSHLLSQIVWYFIEGKNGVWFTQSKNIAYNSFIVMHEDKEIIFYKDPAVNRWWIALEDQEGQEKLIPCSENDYEMAKNNEIPDRYWKNIKRFL